jgi:hypothetical protein
MHSENITHFCWIDLNPGLGLTGPGLPLPLTERSDRGHPTRHWTVGPCRQCLYKWVRELMFVTQSKPYT